MKRMTFAAVVAGLLLAISIGQSAEVAAKPRVIVTTDGEADDRCSLVRFLLTCNEFDVEGIINSSSQFHWEGGSGWNAFHPVPWVKDYIGLYAKVYDNLRLHDTNYLSPDYLLSRWKVGNVSAIGEDNLRTEGAEWPCRLDYIQREHRGCVCL